MQNANEKNAQASLFWLAAGAIAGLVLAAFGLVERGGSAQSLPEDAVARVGETLIGTEQLERAIDQVETGFATTLDADGSARILQQRIEEELLVQRGLELGLAESEPTVRAAIVQSMIASVTAEADAADPDDATLEQFMRDNRERYTYASAMSVEAWTTDDEDQAQDFVEALGRSADAAPPEALAPVPGLPGNAIPVERLRMFLGPAITAAAADMPVGSAAVFARQGRWYVVRVAGREASVLADLDALRSQVLIDYRRMLADRRLRDYLDGLRERTDIVVAAP